MSKFPSPIFLLNCVHPLANRPALGNRPPRAIDLVGIKPALWAPARPSTALLTIIGAVTGLVDPDLAFGVELGDMESLVLPVLGGTTGDEGAFPAGIGLLNVNRQAGGARVANLGDSEGSDGGSLVDNGCGGSGEERAREGDEGDEVGCELHLG